MYGSPWIVVAELYLVTEMRPESLTITVFGERAAVRRYCLLPFKANYRVARLNSGIRGRYITISSSGVVDGWKQNPDADRDFSNAPIFNFNDGKVKFDTNWVYVEFTAYPKTRAIICSCFWW